MGLPILASVNMSFRAGLGEDRDATQLAGQVEQAPGAPSLAYAHGAHPVCWLMDFRSLCKEGKTLALYAALPRKMRTERER